MAVFSASSLGAAEYTAELSPCYDENNALGLRLSLWLSLMEERKSITFSKENTKSMSDYQMILMGSGVKAYGIQGVSVDQIIEGLNQFYKDFRNTQMTYSPG